jgi:phospholipid/cholesterol/gamma-HCH transport system ATP-binding protein
MGDGGRSSSFSLSLETRKNIGFLSQPMEFAVQTRNVSFRINRRVIFDDLEFSVAKGQALFIVGGSGSGKSLLLQICAGLIVPDTGRVTLGGIDLQAAAKKEVQELRARIGFVFQDSALISNMAIYDNIALPLRYHKKCTEKEVQARVEEKMALFGVDRTVDWSIPAMLSLEMRKRAALARAFILDPEYLLLDQPTSGLETDTAYSLNQIISDYQRRTGTSLLEVGSEYSLSGGYADRIGVLEDGHIAAEGTVEEMQSFLERENRPGKAP